MSIEDQPGYPGLTSKGVLALHADWPAYPVDHGWTTASFYLCSFPAETTFTVVDEHRPLPAATGRLSDEAPEGEAHRRTLAAGLAHRGSAMAPVGVFPISPGTRHRTPDARPARTGRAAAQSGASACLRAGDQGQSHGRSGAGSGTPFGPRWLAA